MYFLWCGCDAHYNIPPRAWLSLSLSLKIPTFSNQFKSFVWLYFPFSLQIFRSVLYTHSFIFYERFAFFFSPSPVHGPFNSNVLARSSFSRPRRIYHVPVVKRPTIRDIHHSAVKKVPFYMEKFAEPSLHPSDKIMFSVYKKKRRIFQRSN